MSIDIESFHVREGRTVNLKSWPTRVKPFYKSKHDCGKLLAGHVEKLSTRQKLLYALHPQASGKMTGAKDPA